MSQDRDGTTLLAVDGDGRLEPVIDALRSAGIERVLTVPDIGAAEREVATRSIDSLLLLDAPAREPLEKVDGPTQVREAGTLIGDISVMVYVLSNGHRALVECFEAGADDVCRAPASREELTAQKVRYVADNGGTYDDLETQFRSLIESHPLDIFNEFEREWITNLTD